MSGMDGHTQAGNGYTIRHALVITADQAYRFHMDKTYRYEACLPASLEQTDLDRLRELGEVRMIYVVEGSSRSQVIRDLVTEHSGWRRDLADPDWWQGQLSRGVEVRPHGTVAESANHTDGGL